MTLAPCPGCGGLFARIEGPTHPYMLSSAGCWSAYGAVLAREYAEPALFAAVHRLTVDAYAIQHPGDPDDRRARQSVWIHFAALHAIFLGRRSHAEAQALLRGHAGQDFSPLPPMPTPTLTVADVDPARHVETVTAWARAAFDCWQPVLPPLPY